MCEHVCAAVGLCKSKGDFQLPISPSIIVAPKPEIKASGLAHIMSLFITKRCCESVPPILVLSQKILQTRLCMFFCCVSKAIEFENNSIKYFNIVLL